MALKILSREEIFTEDPEWRKPGRSNYLAMYSSVFGGVVTDPALMVLPLDDHMVHRGDAVFEAFTVVNGSVYDFDSHMNRFKASLEMISLDLPYDMDTIKEIVLETIAISNARDAVIRLYASRGIGDFGCDPTTCGKSQFYAVVAIFPPESNPSNMSAEGISAMTSHVPMKPGFYAQVKSTCYLLNALSFMEAHRNNVDIAIWFDQNGYMAEAPIESVAIVSKDKIYKYPKFDHILKGTTLLRSAELVKELVKSKELNGISQTDISHQDVYDCMEMFMLVTGWVVPIVRFDGRTIGTGKPGPIFHRILELLEKDKMHNKEVLTPVPYK